MHAVAAGSVVVVCETDAGTLLRSRAAGWSTCPQPMEVVLAWLDGQIRL
jgi:hypothetical protein